MVSVDLDTGTLESARDSCQSAGSHGVIIRDRRSPWLRIGKGGLNLRERGIGWDATATRAKYLLPQWTQALLRSARLSWKIRRRNRLSVETGNVRLAQVLGAGIRSLIRRGAIRSVSLHLARELSRELRLPRKLAWKQPGSRCSGRP